MADPIVGGRLKMIAISEAVFMKIGIHPYSLPCLNTDESGGWRLGWGADGHP